MKSASAVCLAFVLTIAAAIAYAVLVATAYSAWEDARFDATQRVPNRYESLRVSNDGDVVIRVSNMTTYGHDQPDDQFLDFDRQPIPPPVKNTRLLQTSLPADSGGITFNRLGPEQRVMFVHPYGGGAQDWYFVFEDWPGGHGRFELYDVRTRRLIGYLGRSGFLESPPDQSDMFVIDGAEMANQHGASLLGWERIQRVYGDYNLSTIHFAGRYPIARDQLVLPTSDSLYLIDFRERTVEQQLPDETVLSAAAASRLHPLPDDFVPRGPDEEDCTLQLRIFLAVRTVDEIRLLNPNDGTRAELPLPEELAGRHLQFYFTVDGGAVATSYVEGSGEPIAPSTFASDSHVWWIAPDGRVTRQADVTLDQPGSMTNLDAFLPVLLPAPLLSLGGVSVVMAALNPWVAQQSFVEEAGGYLSRTWPMQLLVILLSAGLAYAAHRQRVNHRLPRSFGWIAFVFVFGLPGFVGYLLHRRWPLRHPLSLPQRTGAEVFT